MVYNLIFLDTNMRAKQTFQRGFNLFLFLYYPYAVSEGNPYDGQR